MLSRLLESLLSWLRVDKHTLKNSVGALINFLFVSSTLVFLYKTIIDSMPYFNKKCADDPVNGCDIGDFSSAVYRMLKDKFTESFYDGMFQATFTYSFVGALNALEAHIRHAFREYEENVIGWNILVHDRRTGRIRLEIPTEDTCSMKELMLEDQVLMEKVRAARNARSRSGPYPDFFIVMDSERDQSEFMRRIVNRVSQSIKSSQWPSYAMSVLGSQEDREEHPIAIAVSEKDQGMQSYMMRTWLVFPSVLRELLRYSEAELMNPDGPFAVAREHHRIRLKNLRLWAVAEYETKGIDRAYMSTAIFLPRALSPPHPEEQGHSHSPSAGSAATPARGTVTPATPPSSRRSTRIAARKR